MPSIAASLVLLTGMMFDIAPEPITRFGETIAPRTDTSVEMSAETVTIELAADRAKVTAVFTLKNTSDKKEELEVGFPTAAQPESWTSSKDGVDVDKWGPTTISDFTATVDGASVKAEPKSPSKMGGSGIRGWLCWPMAFDGGQKHEVTVTYTVPTKDVNYSEPSRLENRQVSYILRTGDGWKNPIGSAKIVLKFDGVRAENILKSAPEPTAKKDGEWDWEWTRLDPTADVLIQYRVYNDAKDAIAKLTKALEAAPDDAAGLLDLAENLEADGQKEKAAEAFGKLDAFEAKTDGYICRAKTAWVPPAMRAAQNYREAGKKAEGVAWAKKAAAKLEAILNDSKKNSFLIHKRLRTNEDALQLKLNECQGWAEE